MKAIIMAGGEGTRLRPLTCKIPKPMVPVMDVPTLEHMINLLKKHRIIDIAMTLQYLPNKIIDYFGDGSRFGVNIAYYTEDVPLGTAGSVKNTKDFIDDTFIVLSGDALTDIDLSAAVGYHKSKNAVCTLVLKTVETPLEYGVVITDDDGKINRFIEKPGWSEVFSDKVNTGIYIIEPMAIEFVKQGTFFDFSKDLFPKLMESGMQLYGYEADGYWCDVGDIEALRQCHFDALEGKIKIEMKSKPYENGVYIGENVTIERGAYVYPPIYIGDNCRIKTGAHVGNYTILGNNVTIGENAAIGRSIVWDFADVGGGAQLQGTTVCDKVRVETGAVLYENTVIGSGCEIGAYSVIEPDTKIWNDKMVDSGEVIQDNLIWGHGQQRHYFQSGTVLGETNAQITPEYCAKVSAAFASMFQSGKFAISSDDDFASLMLKGAVSSGLLSGGATLLDFGQQTLPITRLGVKFYGLSGGVHIYATDGGRMVGLCLLDKDGCNISKNDERKLWQMYSRGDYKKSSGDAIGETLPLPSYKMYYLREMINSQRNAQLPYNILIASQSGMAKDLLTSLLTDVGCKFTFADLDIEDKQQCVDFGARIGREGFDFGVYLDNLCENTVLFDDNGNMIDAVTHLCLSAYMVLSTQAAKTFVAPMHMPEILEVMASKFGGKIQRSKNHEVMRRVLGDYKNTEMQFALQYDGLGAVLRIMDYLKKENLTLSSLLSKLPQFHVKIFEGSCENEEKGYLIRNLVEISKNKKMDLYEGVKVYEKGGWAMVLPDEIRGSYNVYCEGFTEEIAQEIMADYTGKIQQILKKEEKNEKNSSQTGENVL